MKLVEEDYGKIQANEPIGLNGGKNNSQWKEEKQMKKWIGVGWLVACLLTCLTSQQHASVSQGWIC